MALCSVVVVLAACGGSYKGLSKADYVKQAEAICKAGNAKVETFAEQFGPHPALEQVKQAYNEQLLPIYRDELKQLQALKPPKADRDTINKMLDDLSDGIDQAKTAIASAKTQDDFDTLAEPAGLKQASAEAKAYGLPTCGQE